jgi:hypothetical protein
MTVVEPQVFKIEKAKEFEAFRQIPKFSHV